MAGRLRRRRSGQQPLGGEWLPVFVGFLKIGATSFGGGSATIVAMRQLALRRGWLTEQEFLDTVVLSRLTPGITILAQVLLIGKKVCGIRGMLAAVVGLLLPAISITIGLAQIYNVVSSSPSAATPLRCIAGVAAGFAVALAVQLLRDTLVRSHLVLGPLMVLGYVGLTLLVNNPLVILVTALAAGAALPALFATRTGADES
jgi:chromate transporter